MKNLMFKKHEMQIIRKTISQKLIVKSQITISKGKLNGKRKAR
jgi:hypothetical protein